jgi:hypothetical protein
MAAARVAREEIAEEAERGAVRVYAIGTHQLRPPSPSEGTAYRNTCREVRGWRRAWQESSLRVRALVRRDRR